MKIIMPGKVEESSHWWAGKRFSCNGCKCIFELEKQDYTINVPEFHVKCPCCNRLVRIKKPSSPLSKKPIFDEVFGDGGLFEKVFGKRK